MRTDDRIEHRIDEWARARADAPVGEGFADRVLAAVAVVDAAGERGDAAVSAETHWLAAPPRRRRWGTSLVTLVLAAALGAALIQWVPGGSSAPPESSQPVQGPREPTSPQPSTEPSVPGEPTTQAAPPAALARDSAAGTVFDAAGLPLAGALVSIRSLVTPPAAPLPRGWKSPQATTGAAGDYVLAPLPEGQLELVATHAEHADGVLVLELAAGESVSGVDFNLETGLSVAGAVVDDGGQPIAGAVVAATRGVPGLSGQRVEIRRTATAAADGTFTVTGLEPGGYQLAASHPDYFAGEQRDSPSASVQVPSAHPELRFVLRRGGTVRGRVVDVDGAAVAGAGVVAHPKLAGLSSLANAGPRLDVGPFTATTAEDGSFELRGVPGGACGVFAMAAGYLPSAIHSCELHADLPVEGLRLLLDPGLSLHGRCIDPAGAPLEGVALTLSAQNYAQSLTEGARARATSDSSGAFALTGMAPGVLYRIAAKKEGYSLAPEAQGATYTAAAEPVVLTLAQHATIRGTVRDQQGEPVRVTVQAICDELRESAGHVQTDESGAYELSSLPAGRIRITCSKLGYFQTQALELDLAPQEVREGVDIVLATGGVITGQVLDEQGAPVPGASVSCRPPPHLQAAFSGRSCTTAEDGVFRLEGLPDTELTLQVTPPPGFIEHQAVDGVAPLGDHVILRLARGATLTGRVVTDSGEPVVQFLVRAAYTTPGGGGSAHPQRSFSNADGTFSFPALPRTLYRIAVEAAGYATEARVIDGFPATGTHDAGTFTLSPGGAVSGVALAADGQPAAGAQITLSQVISEKPGRHIPPWSAQRTTSADGRFEFTGLAAASFELVAEGSGCQPAKLALELSRAEEKRGLVLRLVPGAAIFGKVALPSLELLRSAEIREIRCSDLNDGRNRKSMELGSAGGDFRFDGLTPGTYTVTLLVYIARDTWSFNRVVELPPAGEVRCDFDGASTCRVFGRVGGWQGGARPVRLTGTAGEQSTEISADGAFTFAAVLPGSYFLHVGAVNAHEFVVPAAREHELNFSLPAGAVRGQVVADAGAELGYTWVVVSPRGGERSFNAAVDSNGAFELLHLAPGAYELRAERAGFGRSEPQEVQVPEGGAVEGVVLVVVRGGVILVSVADASGQPVTDANLSCQDSAGARVPSLKFRAIAGSPGDYRLSGLNTGTYRVYAGQFAHATGFTDQVAVSDDAETMATVTIPSGSEIAVKLTRAGQPAADVRVALVDERGWIVHDNRAEHMEQNPYETDRDGTCTTGRFPAGRYLLRIGPAAAPVEHPVTLPAGGAVVRVELELD